jgi:hypothetical protein
LGYFCNFRKTAQSQQSPVGRKSAQSGHPGYEPTELSFCIRASSIHISVVIFLLLQMKTIEIFIYFLLYRDRGTGVHPQPGANPSIAGCNASVVKNYSAPNSMARFFG